SLEFLRDEAALIFDTQGREFLKDPWQARNDYIPLLLDHGESKDGVVRQHARRAWSESEKDKVMALLEMQHNSLLMFTSCAWFFSDISGIETVQIMRYAARLIEQFDQLGAPSPRAEFLKMLAKAHSNVRGKGNGAEIYLLEAERQSTTHSGRERSRPGHYR